MKILSEKTPWWAKLVLYGGIATGALVIVYFTLRSIFLGGIDAYKDMWSKQYNELIRKMAGYTQSNPDGFTTAQQQNIAEEEKVLQLTTQGLAEASNGLYNTLIWMTAIVVGGLVAVGVGSAIVNKWVNKTKGQWNTASAVPYIAIMSFADDLATRGYPTQATNLVASAQTMFQTFDMPFMQSTIQTLQNSLPQLTGIQLLVAQQMIAVLNVELINIPIWLTTPLPIPLGK